MVIPNEGLLLWLLWAFDDSGVVQEDFVVDLYQNNYTPEYTSTGANFTVANFPLYAQVALPRSSFGAPTASGGTGTIVSSVTPSWEGGASANQTVYGWYMRGASSGKVLAAQAFPAAPTVIQGLTVSLGPMTFQMG